MITNPTITVDAANRLPHGTVRRSPEGFAHAILLDQFNQSPKWHIIDLYGPMETETDADVVDWPVVYVPAPDEVWRAVNGQPDEPVALTPDQPVLLAVRGQSGESSQAVAPIHGPLCSEINGVCVSMHCPRCGGLTGPQGHMGCFPEFKQ